MKVAVRHSVLEMTLANDVYTNRSITVFKYPFKSQCYLESK